MELLVVIALAGVMLAIGGVSFQSSVERNRLRSSFNSVVDMVSFARSEAAIRSLPIAACASTDGGSCGGISWETGWLVFVDDGSGLGGTVSDGVLNGGEEILHLGAAQPNGVSVRTANFPAAGSIGFRDDGRIAQNVTGTFVVCNAQGSSDARGLVIEVSGQGRLTADANADGVDEDDEGNALSCP